MVILKGSDDGILHVKLQYSWTLTYSGASARKSTHDRDSDYIFLTYPTEQIPPFHLTTKIQSSFQNGTFLQNPRWIRYRKTR
jgi:hypothetical protein